MSVSTITKIDQIAPDTSSGRVRDLISAKSSITEVRSSNFSRSSIFTYTHIYPVSIPTAAIGKSGWPTTLKNDWSDSPSDQPNLLYRQRFSFGRDPRDPPTISPGSDGQRLGNLDDYSALLLYNRLFGMSSSTNVRSFRLSSSTKIRDFNSSISSNAHERQLGIVEGDTTLQQFAFSVLATPAPFSEKNPVDTNVFIRLSNFSHTIVPGTISMSFNGVPHVPLQITEFFGGLGGYDVLWVNDELFPYDATIHVKILFQDDDVPANTIRIEYPFYTVSDLRRPRIRNIVPLEDATGVSITSFIQFDLVDFENGVDISSFVLYVNGILATSEQIQITELINENGFRIRYNSNQIWLYGDLIGVAIFAKDNSAHKNELFYTFSFTTEESIPPALIFPSPTPCYINSSVLTDVELTIVDGGHGLDKNSIIITIDEQEPVGMAIVPIIYRKD